MREEKSWEKNIDLLYWLLDIAARNKIGHDRLEEVQKLYYLLKIIDLIWFETLVPNNLSSQFELFLNPNWPGRPPTWFHHLAAMPVACLEFLATKVNKPDWLQESPSSKNLTVYGYSYLTAWIKSNVDKNVS